MSDLPVAYAVPLRPRRYGLLNWLWASVSLRAEDEAIRRSREKLAEYDDRLLSDIGLTREQALGRAPRPEWATPDWLVMTRAR